jgi:hypothetical protein
MRHCITCGGFLRGEPHRRIIEQRDLIAPILAYPPLSIRADIRTIETAVWRCRKCRDDTRESAEAAGGYSD